MSLVMQTPIGVSSTHYPTAASKPKRMRLLLDPAHDLQAMDRAYRFGQTRDVEVYRLLGAGSLEELIYARQLYKQQQMAIGYDASIQTRCVILRLLSFIRLFRVLAEYRCSKDILRGYRMIRQDRENYLVSK